MKSHKYWSIGALITMLGTFYTRKKVPVPGKMIGKTLIKCKRSIVGIPTIERLRCICVFA